MSNTDAKSGEGWTRQPDTNPNPEHGTPKALHGDAPLWSRRPEEVANPEIRKLILHPEAPYGWDEHGVRLTEEGWNSRFARPNKSDGAPGGIDWPGNDGAVPGTRVRFNDLDALLREYPEFHNLGRLGGKGGDYLAAGGTPFEQLSLTPGHSAFAYNNYELTGRLPDHVYPEVSVVEPGLGFPGGGWQIRFWDDISEDWIPVGDLLNTKKYGVIK